MSIDSRSLASLPIDPLRLLSCSETAQRLGAASQGASPANQPVQPETWAAMRALCVTLLDPLQAQFGPITLTYGFAGPALVRAVRARAHAEGRTPCIAPALDQHAGYELGRSGRRICNRDGLAVDLQIPPYPANQIAAWIIEHLPFDRLYLYGPDRPLHLSWAPTPVGQVVEMVWDRHSGRRVPRLLVKDRCHDSGATEM